MPGTSSQNWLVRNVEGCCPAWPNPAFSVVWPSRGSLHIWFYRSSLAIQIANIDFVREEQRIPWLHHATSLDHNNNQLQITGFQQLPNLLGWASLCRSLFSIFFRQIRFDIRFDACVTPRVSRCIKRINQSIEPSSSLSLKKKVQVILGSNRRLRYCSTTEYMYCTEFYATRHVERNGQTQDVQELWATVQ